MPHSVTGIRRGCGFRIPGGLYVCSGLDPDGSPIDEFLIDPPLPYNGERFRAPFVFQRGGRQHLMMWVGAEYYPYCSDFVEEVRRFGVSKRIATNFPIERLTKESLLFLVHPRARCEDHGLLPPVEYCPKGNAEHISVNEPYCLGHSYTVADPNAGGTTRTIGDTSYTVYPHSMCKVNYEHSAGIFMRVPITHFDHIVTIDGKANPSIVAKTTALPVNLETM